MDACSCGVGLCAQDSGSRKFGACFCRAVQCPCGNCAMRAPGDLPLLNLSPLTCRPVLEAGQYADRQADPKVTEHRSMAQFLIAEPGESALTALADALDQVDIGILLLDRDLRIRFFNRRQMEIFAFPTELLTPGMTFGEMLH